MSTYTLEESRDFVAKYGPPAEAIRKFSGGGRDTSKENQFLDQTPDRYIFGLRELIDKNPAAVKAISAAIVYARNYAKVFYFPAETPRTVTEKIDALEAEWLSKQRVGC